MQLDILSSTLDLDIYDSNQERNAIKQKIMDRLYRVKKEGLTQAREEDMKARMMSSKYSYSDYTYFMASLGNVVK